MNCIFIKLINDCVTLTHRKVKQAVQINQICLSKQNQIDVTELQINVGYFIYKQEITLFERIIYKYLHKKALHILDDLLFDYCKENMSERISYVLPLYHDGELKQLDGFFEMLAKYNLKWINYHGNIKEHVIEFIENRRKKQIGSEKVLVFSTPDKFDANVVKKLIQRYKKVDVYIPVTDSEKLKNIQYVIAKINIDEGTTIELITKLSAKKSNEYNVIIWLENITTNLFKDAKFYNVHLYNDDRDVYNEYVQQLKKSEVYKQLDIEKTRDIANRYGRVNTAYILCNKLKLCDKNKEK